MKKFLAIFLVLILNLQTLTAFAEINLPKWQDRCPKEYLDAKYNDNIYWTFCNKWSEVLLLYSIIGIPTLIKRQKSYKIQLINNYWVRKRELFKKQLEFCSSFEDQTQQGFCYKVLDTNFSLENNLKELEFFKTRTRGGIVLPDIFTNNYREYRLSL